MNAHMPTHVALYTEPAVATRKLAYVRLLARVRVAVDTQRRRPRKCLSTLSAVVPMLLRLPCAAAVMVIGRGRRQRRRPGARDNHGRWVSGSRMRPGSAPPRLSAVKSQHGFLTLQL